MRHRLHAEFHLYDLSGVDSNPVSLVSYKWFGRCIAFVFLPLRRAELADRNPYCVGCFVLVLDDERDAASRFSPYLGVGSNFPPANGNFGAVWPTRHSLSRRHSKGSDTQRADQGHGTECAVHLAPLFSRWPARTSISDVLQSRMHALRWRN